ncbi:hypothetical protein GH733_016030 [Mirounga leonina]|nr:hypothetical protein GH733_016030 [Mirounga leonina]
MPGNSIVEGRNSPSPPSSTLLSATAVASQTASRVSSKPPVSCWFQPMENPNRQPRRAFENRPRSEEGESISPHKPAANAFVNQFSTRREVISTNKKEENFCLIYGTKCCFALLHFAPKEAKYKLYKHSREEWMYRKSDTSITKPPLLTKAL